MLTNKKKKKERDFSEAEFQRGAEAFEKARTPKEYREVHKKYKQIGFDIPFWQRYPNFNTWLMGIAVIFQLMVLIKLLLK